MIFTVERHPIEPATAAKHQARRSKSVQSILEQARINPKALPILFDDAACGFAYATVADPHAESEENWGQLILAAQAAAAMFALVIPDPGEPTHVLIRSEQITLPATGPVAGIIDIATS